MSGAELYALGALGASYLDARWRLLDDFKTIRGAAGLYFKMWRAERTGRINGFFRIEEEAQSNPNNLAIVYPKQITTTLPKDRLASLDDAFEVQRWTFGEFYDIILRYARVLRDQFGTRAGDIVALDCTNKPDFLFVWLALWSLGATPAFINYNLTNDSLVHCVKVAGSKFLIADPDIAENVEAVRGEIEGLGKPILYLDETFHGLAKVAKPYRAPDEDRIKNHAMHTAGVFIFTSGTTGLPKSAVMSWQKILVGGGSYNVAVRMSKSDIVYSPMPLYHSTGAVLGAMASLLSGSAFAVGHKFSSRTFWTQAKLSQASYIQYVGETCRYLLNSPPGPDDQVHGVKAAVGNGFRSDIWPKFKDRFKIDVIGEFYGATEFPTGLTNYQKGEYGIGAVAAYGLLLQTFLFKSRYTIAAVDTDDPNEIWRDPSSGFGRKVDCGEPGEFLFKIPDPKNIEATFQGYHGNKKATSEKIVRNLFTAGDAYVRSGDLLKWDKEGMVYFVDRMGDTFRWKSENVSTNEVEAAFTSIPGIYQVVVVGVQVPNHEGRAGFAVIQLEENAPTPDLGLLAETISKKLPKYAVPVFLKFTETPLDSTGTNKIQKGKYRNQQIPHPTETIYWLKGDSYVPLEVSDWKQVEAGRARL